MSSSGIARDVLDGKPVDTDAERESITSFGGPSLVPTVARRVAIAFSAFVIAWLAAALAAKLLFGSGNVLVWVIATVVGIGAYLVLVWQEQRAGQGRIRW